MAKCWIRCLGVRIRPTIEHAIIVLLLIIAVFILEKRTQTGLAIRTPSHLHHYVPRDKRTLVEISTPSRPLNHQVVMDAGLDLIQNNNQDTANNPKIELVDKRNQERAHDGEYGKEDAEDGKEVNSEADKNNEQSSYASHSNIEASPLLKNLSVESHPDNTSTEVERLADERQRHLAAECDRLGQNKKGWPPTPANLLVNDKLKAIYCMVGKVASSTWKKVFLMATGHIDPSRINETRNVKLGARANKAFVPLNSVAGPEKRRRLETYFRFMFVRHPLDRLTSTYLEKFHLMPTYIRPIARRIVREYRPNATAASLESGNDVSFEEFVRFIIDHGRKKSDIHWTPQSRLCLPCSMRYNFIGHYETMWFDADHVLRRLGVPQAKASFPRWSNSRKSGSRYEEMIAKLDPQYVDKLKTFYAQDYELFGYT